MPSLSQLGIRRFRKVARCRGLAGTSNCIKGYGRSETECLELFPLRTLRNENCHVNIKIEVVLKVWVTG